MKKVALLFIQVILVILALLGIRYLMVYSNDEFIPLFILNAGEILLLITDLFLVSSITLFFGVIILCIISKNRMQGVARFFEIIVAIFITSGLLHILLNVFIDVFSMR